ncbi:dihydropyrimidinase-related protein 3-like [Tubulanus polymorphus]|uniref:dihydropyrimidinase-related protein 3-like n=1 Tax=Tubulanus polymorphus TaxID=672921 RepID=UPI003DA3C1E2
MSAHAQTIPTVGLKKVPIHLQSAQTRLLIKGGRVVNDDGTFNADVYMEDGLVKQLGHDLVIPGGTRTIDARGKLIIPGGVDANTHFQCPLMGATTADDFYSGTKAALAGGTTTIIDCIMEKPGEKETYLQVYDRWLNEIDEKVCCDYVLRVGITRWNEETPVDIENLIRTRGVNTFVSFMTYKDMYQMTDADLYGIFKTCKQHGAMVQIVAENGDLVGLKAQELIDQGITGPEGHLLARPEENEGEAITRAVTIAKQANCPLYIIGVLSKTASNAVAAARREGALVFCETWVSALAGGSGRNYYSSDWITAAHTVSVPPLRPDPSTTSHLINFLSSGSIQVTASGHSPFSLVDRGLGYDDFRKIPHGVHGVQERMSVLWETCVNTGEMTPNQFVAITSSNAAKIFNIYPQKGRIALGSDADLLIWDPNLVTEISVSKSLSKVKYNMFEGMKCKGGPIIIVSQGRVIYEEGELHVSQGAGRFIETPANNEQIYSKIAARDKAARKVLPVTRMPVSIPSRDNSDANAESEQDILKHPSEKGTGLDNVHVDRRAKVRVQEPPGGKSSLFGW